MTLVLRCTGDCGHLQIHRELLTYYCPACGGKLAYSTLPQDLADSLEVQSSIASILMLQPWMFLHVMFADAE